MEVSDCDIYTLYSDSVKCKQAFPSLMLWLMFFKSRDQTKEVDALKIHKFNISDPNVNPNGCW